MKQFLDLDRRFAIAHRGGARRRPENTMTAFDDAVALGVDAIELDIHLSIDGIPVVIHDPTLERTTDGRGAVADHTADALGRLDAAYAFEDSGQFPFRGQGIGISTLEQVLTRHRDMPFMVELKGATVELATRAVEVVRRSDAVERVLFGSFSDVGLGVIRRSGLPLITSAAVPEGLMALLRSFVWIGPGRGEYRLFQVPERRKGFRIVSPRFVRLARHAGLPVQVWVVNEEDDMRRLLSWGVTGLISDRPDRAIKVIRS
ncbi:MAG: glycerophosphodiester phosphodiesterase [Acidobacteriota bacterium]